MKKVLLVCLFIVGMNLSTSCNPDSIADQEYEEIQSTDKNNNGTIGNSGGQDPDEDYN
ncbi:hypothetical protein H2O64_20890 [Kordia sp. YSTF-M3]|uniref:Uncharacterized protein n=1 Tax=Kordia aestuariivivens TaxID=2759037 RepID=A0ABR7QEY8_9FLAO|nr:hypothetical protein [Kordia aestuariivivens]MBC8757139.1 hypothetical protein [Kordia aestuariivivens]